MCVSGVRGNNNYIPDNTKVNKSSSEKPSTASEPKTQEVSVSKQDKANMSETKQSAKFDPANSNISFGEIKKENKSDEQKISDWNKRMEHEWDNGGINPPPHKIDPGKLGEILEKLKTDPAKVIENIRNSKGNERDENLLNFKGTLDHMSKSELKDMRDYIGKEMSSPTNKDDQLLGSLLNAVNKEIDSRGNEVKPPHIFDILTKSPGENGSGPINIKPNHDQIIQFENLMKNDKK